MFVKSIIALATIFSVYTVYTVYNWYTRSENTQQTVQYTIVNSRSEVLKECSGRRVYEYNVYNENEEDISQVYHMDLLGNDVVERRLDSMVREYVSSQASEASEDSEDSEVSHLVLIVDTFVALIQIRFGIPEKYFILREQKHSNIPNIQ